MLRPNRLGPRPHRASRPRAGLRSSSRASAQWPQRATQPRPDRHAEALLRPVKQARAAHTAPAVATGRACRGPAPAAWRAAGGRRARPRGDPAAASGSPARPHAGAVDLDQVVVRQIAGEVEEHHGLGRIDSLAASSRAGRRDPGDAARRAPARARRVALDCARSAYSSSGPAASTPCRPARELAHRPATGRGWHASGTTGGQRPGASAWPSDLRTRR